MPKQIPSLSILKLTSKVKYGLLVLLELADYPVDQKPLTIKDIAARQPIPERYLEQLLASLRQGGLVKSLRGARGGYQLARQPCQITLLQVVVSTESQRKRFKNSGHLNPDRESIRSLWQDAITASEIVLQQYTLQDLCQRREEHRKQSSMFYI